jgi:hypothetical protein
VGKFDYLEHQFDDQFQQTVQSDLDMLLLEKMYETSRGKGPRGGCRGHATSGWRNRGLFFWIILALGILWFLLRPLGP